MIDSHCHLADDAFAEDADAVLARARDAGVSQAVCILEGANETEERRAAALAGRWPALRTAVGVHPHAAGPYGGRVQAAVDAVRAQIARDPRARAVGEIGLDYHYDHAPRDVQREVFAAQVRLARELDLPVVIHTREADDDTVAIIEAEGAAAGPSTLRGVIHCFTGGPDLARRCLDLGFLLSFAGIVTFPRAAALRDTARLVPLDRLLVETDAPYLAPVPYRGKRNEPAWVERVLAGLAALHAMAPERLDAQVTENFTGLFRP